MTRSGASASEEAAAGSRRRFSLVLSECGGATWLAFPLPRDDHVVPIYLGIAVIIIVTFYNFGLAYPIGEPPRPPPPAHLHPPILPTRQLRPTALLLRPRSAYVRSSS